MVTSARERIRMSEAEIAEFLDAPHTLQLATINRDGTPHLTSMYYAMVDGRVAFWTYRKSQKARNLERDPRATCLVETGGHYGELRGVQINGHVVPSDDADRVREIGVAISRRYIGEIAGYIEQQVPKRRAYLLEPRTIATWDHRKLMEGER